MCSWVQNGEAQYSVLMNRGCRHFAPRKHTCPHREVSELSTWLNFISCFVKDGHERLVYLYIVSMNKYLIFIRTIPIPSAEEFQLFKPHPISTHLDVNTEVISSIYIKPQNSYFAISSNKQSYFTTNENFLSACYQNGFQTFCHPPRSIFNIDNNPNCETSMFLNSQPYKCEIFISFSEYPFLTPLKFHQGWLYSTIFPRQIFLSCLKNSKTLIILQGIGILQIKSVCNLDSSTPYYHLQNHLNIMNNSIPVSKSTTSLATKE